MGDPRLLPKEDNSTMATNCIAILVAKYRIAGMTPYAGHCPATLRYDTSIMENTMTNSATVSPTPKTIR